MAETTGRRGYRAEYDSDVDALYVYLNDLPYASGRDLDEARRVDYGPDGTPRGLEFLSPRAVGVDLRGLAEGAGIGDIPGLAATLTAMGFTVLAEVPR
jgi:uncharacterized protein YuzE